MNEFGTASRCCPGHTEIWTLRCASWRPPRSLLLVRTKKLERPAGIAPASPEWRSGVLLLDDGRIKRSGAGNAALRQCPAPLTTKKNKHRCQLGELTPAGRFHGGSFGV